MMKKMKRFAAVMMAALTLTTAAVTTSMPAMATVADGYYVTTAGSGLALRNGCGTSYTAITYLPYDTSVQVLEFCGDWAYVHVPSFNIYGYVYAGYITADGDSAGKYYSSYSSGYGNMKTCCVSESYLALRTAPAFKYENEIGKIWPGQQVYVEWYEDNGYAYVYAPTLGQYGYVNASFIC